MNKNIKNKFMLTLNSLSNTSSEASESPRRHCYRCYTQIQSLGYICCSLLLSPGHHYLELAMVAVYNRCN